MPKIKSCLDWVVKITCLLMFFESCYPYVWVYSLVASDVKVVRKFVQPYIFSYRFQFKS